MPCDPGNLRRPGVRRFNAERIDVPSPEDRAGGEIEERDMQLTPARHHVEGVPLHGDDLWPVSRDQPLQAERGVDGLDDDALGTSRPARRERGGAAHQRIPHRSRQTQSDPGSRSQPATLAKREGQTPGEHEIPERRELPRVLVAVDDRIRSEAALPSGRVLRGICIHVVGLVIETDPTRSAERVAEPGCSRARDADQDEPVGPRDVSRSRQLPFTHARTFLHWSTISGRP